MSKISTIAKFSVLGAMVAALFVGVGGASARDPIQAQGAKAKPAEEGDAPKALTAKIQEILDRIAKRPDRVWIEAFELRQLAGKDNKNAATLASVLAPKLEDENSFVRLAASQVCLGLGAGDEEAVFETLAGLVKDAEKLEVAAVAARVASDFDPKKPETFVKAIRDRIAAVTGEPAAAALISLSEADLKLSKEPIAADRLRGYLTSGSRELGDRAALALARSGFMDDVRGRVTTLAKQSGELSLVARLALEVDGDSREIKRVEKEGLTPTTGKPRLVPEVAVKTARSYADSQFTHGIDPLDLTTKNLMDAACRGMTDYLDPFSEFMTAKEYKTANERLNGDYVGIGAHVAKTEDDPAVRIAQPIYDGPAYKAGLRTGDYIWACETGGKHYELAGMEVEPVAAILKGIEDTPVTLYVKRPGVKDLITIELLRKGVYASTTTESLLPGNIGYVRLTQFGGASHIDMYKSLLKLNAAGAKGFIFDLRGNGGGLLNVVLNILALFMPGDPKVALVKGRFTPWDKPEELPAEAPRNRQGQKVAWPSYTQPMVVLIDGQSASGSELTSGALQDNKRATIIGSNSYGKGIGQSTSPVTGDDIATEAAKPEGRMLKCTVFNYYILPTKTSVQRVAGVGGVKPDIVVNEIIPSSWEFHQIVTLRRTKAIQTWARETWDKNRDLYVKLCDYDGYDPNAYPEFDKLFESLKTPLSKERVRRELREELRMRQSDERAAPFAEDYERDFVLQSGIIELSKKMGTDAAKVDKYQPFIKQHEK
jgi:carboxyl-terminal processing protease